MWAKEKRLKYGAHHRHQIASQLDRSVTQAKGAPWSRLVFKSLGECQAEGFEDPPQQKRVSPFSGNVQRVPRHFASLDMAQEGGI